MSKVKIVHELIDNATGEVLAQAIDAKAFKDVARQTIMNEGLSTESVSYIVLYNGARARVGSAVTGSELDAVLYGWDEEDLCAWDDDGGYDPC